MAFAPKVSAAPPYVLALVASQGGAAWRQALLWSLRALHLPQPAVWEQLWQQFPGAWKALLRRARQSLRKHPEAGRLVMVACRPLAPAAAGRAAEEASADEGFLCGVCDAVFTTAAGANTHRGRVHRCGSIVSMKPFVVSSVCPVCQVDFRSRVRAVHHLRWRADSHSVCRTAILDGAVLPASPAALAEADAADQATRRAARLLGSGPLTSGGQFAIRAGDGD